MHLSLIAFRMTHETFWHLCSLIKDDPVFQARTPRRPQRPVHHQLAAFLCRFGSEDALKASCVMTIAEGSIYAYCYRVCRAFRNIRDAYISWPDVDCRRAIKEETSKLGFPGCIGIADGTLFRLTNKPLIEGESYWSRKKFYGVCMFCNSCTKLCVNIIQLAAQVVCDHLGRIQSYELGWPGSVSDVTMFQESDLWLNKEKYFADDEYILVDRGLSPITAEVQIIKYNFSITGYPLTKYSIRPFSDFDLTNDRNEAEWRKLWNQKLSSLRVVIENAFRRLKGRFPCLRNFAVRDLQQAYRIIESIFIIHNIVESMGDDPEEIDGFDNDDAEFEDDDIQGRNIREMLNDDELYQTGVARRKMLLEMFRNV